jgi:WD40 repeat protein
MAAMPVFATVPRLGRLLVFLLLVGGLPGIARAADPQPRITKIATFEHPQVATIAWSGDGRFLASAGLGSLAKAPNLQAADPHVAIWDVGAKKLAFAHRRPGPFVYLSLVGQEPEVLSSYQRAPGWNPGVAFSLWNPRTGELIRHIPGLTPAGVQGALQNNQPQAYSYNHAKGLFAFTRGLDKTIHIHEIKGWSRVAAIPMELDPLRIAISPDGELLAFGQLHHIHVLNIKSGKLVQKILPFRRITAGIAWSPDSRNLALLLGIGREAAGDPLPGEGAQIKVWDVQSGLFKHAYSGDFGGAGLFAQNVDWNADGEVIATSTSDNMVRFWSARGPRLIGVMDENPKAAGPIRFSPTGKYFASAGRNGVHLYGID